jgi:hypothetical protein
MSHVEQELLTTVIQQMSHVEQELLTTVIRQMSHVEQELLTLPKFYLQENINTVGICFDEDDK